MTTNSQPNATLKMTYEEFLAWGDEVARAEWVNGQVYVYGAETLLHQRIVGFLSALLATFVEEFDLGEAMMGPLQVKLPDNGSGREPDLFFVSQQRKGQFKKMYFDGSPDLIVEVVSDESKYREWIDKFEEYEEAGVHEYWIIDPRPRRRRADFYQLGADGKYQPVPTGTEGVYHSAVLPGFWLKVSWLWEDPLPKLMPTLEEIKGK